MENELVKIDWIEKLKSKDLQKKKKNNYYENEEIKYFTIEELDKLMNNIKNKYYKMIFLMLYETASRFSEIKELKFKDIENFLTHELLTHE
jgi:integrase